MAEASIAEPVELCRYRRGRSVPFHSAVDARVRTLAIPRMASRPQGVIPVAPGPSGRRIADAIQIPLR